MGFKFLSKFLVILVIFLFQTNSIIAQNLTVEELFAKARMAAFNDKNYSEAIQLSKQALVKNPDYVDIQVFLGRVYTWNQQPEEARAVFKNIFQKQSKNKEASIAYANLEYWNDNPKQALQIADDALINYPDSEELLLLKTKLLRDLKRYAEAQKTNQNLLKLYPNNTESRSLSQRLTILSAQNQVGLKYDFIYFDEQFDDPWHLASLDYTRQTKLGAIGARFNYANRFNTNAYQVELDAYPTISETFYAYINAGYSTDDAGIFPEYRTGFSLYANLPWALEAEAGFRLLGFEDETWIYTASVGKYYKSFWFNFRTFLTPANESISQSFSFITRYYFGSADDYLNLELGTGISPDNQTNNILYNNGNTYKLKSNNILLRYRRTFGATNIAFIEGSWNHQEYRQNEKGNQYTIGVGYLKRF
ncbi:YaiO family outer membrane beta-barrel protein [Zunongwangia sp.]|uniref:YaiO family outer membrane beta-barrel protein n=1 Tax=Zunongwangia sp. TaxID=1965325 RepID=UPI003AA957A5